MFSLFVACSTKLKTKMTHQHFTNKKIGKKKKEEHIMKTMTSVKQINLQIFKPLK
jgi:hypothetical protein